MRKNRVVARPGKRHNQPMMKHQATTYRRLFRQEAPFAGRFAKALKSVYDTCDLVDARIQGRRELAKLDAHLLKDIGLSEAQRNIECAKPFWKP